MLDLLADIYLVNDADRAAALLYARSNGRRLARYGARITPPPIYYRSGAAWLGTISAVCALTALCCG